MMPQLARTLSFHAKAVVAVGVLTVAGACTVGERNGLVLPDGGFFDVAGDAVRDRITFPDAVVETCGADGAESTVGQACHVDRDCDDGCFCTGTEVCTDGVCVAGADPCIDDIVCTDVACVEEINHCEVLARNYRCADGDLCNGDEVCDPTDGCVSGTPRYCNDEDSCTVDSCDPVLGCVFAPRDLDGDGYVNGSCGGDDCNDDPRTGSEIHPDAQEVCNNGRDDDCDGARDFADPECLPSNDGCGTATVLDGEGIYSGSTKALSGDFAPPCGALSTESPDAVFELTLAELSDLHLALSAIAGAATVALFPMDSCGSGQAVGCLSGTPASGRLRSVAPGDYAVVVKSMAPGASFELSVSLEAPTEPPAIDVCDTATELLHTDGSTVTGAFEDTGDDYVLTCNAGSTASDAAYRLEVPEPSDLSVTHATYTRKTGAARAPYLALTRACDTAAESIACRTGGYGTNALNWLSLAPGTYYLLVEPTPGDAEADAWSLTASLTAAAPRNQADSCATSVDLSDEQAHSVTTSTLLQLDHPTSCGYTDSRSYRDAVFEFTLDETRDVMLTTSAGAAHAVAVETSCGDSLTEVRCRSFAASGNQLLRSRDAGTYYVVVSRAVSASAVVTAQIVTGAPTPVPVNDTCESATAITTSLYDATDSVVDFHDDLTTCGRADVVDAVYRIQVATEARVHVAAIRRTGTGPLSLALGRWCTPDGTRELCTSGGASDLVEIDEVVAAGDYDLVVEMPAADPGDYQLFVTQTPTG